MLVVLLALDCTSSRAAARRRSARASSGRSAGSRSGCRSPASCGRSTAATTASATSRSTSSSARCRSTTSSSSSCCSRTSACRTSYRARLLFWGIIAALVLRGLAILGGTALIEQFHFVLYVLGVLLLVLAYRIYKGVGEDVDPDRNLVVRGVRASSRSPTASARATGSCARTAAATSRRSSCASRRSSPPTSRSPSTRSRRRSRSRRDPLIIWAGNVFALLGLRALFVLVEGPHQALPLPRRDDRRRARARRASSS